VAEADHGVRNGGWLHIAVATATLLAASYGLLQSIRLFWQNRERAQEYVKEIESFVSPHLADSSFASWLAGTPGKRNVRWVTAGDGWRVESLERRRVEEPFERALAVERPALYFVVIPRDTAWALTANLVGSKPRVFSDAFLPRRWPPQRIWQQLLMDFSADFAGHAKIAVQPAQYGGSVVVGKPARVVPIIGHVRGVSFDGLYPVREPTLEHHPFRGGGYPDSVLDAARQTLASQRLDTVQGGAVLGASAGWIASLVWVTWAVRRGRRRYSIKGDS
jgi:hypothetical protein